jgi:peroxiredoxin
LNLKELAGLAVIFIYPWTGKPDHPNPENWDNLPGAHGSTPQTLAYSMHYTAFCRTGVKCFGLSQLAPQWQREFADRNNLRVPLLSDEAGHFADGLGLEYIVTGGNSYLKRRTLIACDQKIIFDRINVSPPEEDAAFALAQVKALAESQPS